MVSTLSCGPSGYQCPICTKQVHDFVAHAEEFKKQGVQVLMVYPGPAELLAQHAQEFLQDKGWPAEFTFVTDPDFAFTNQYRLRWSAPKETAYPSTFLIGTDLKVRFSHISHSHGEHPLIDHMDQAFEEACAYVESTYAAMLGSMPT